MSHKNSRSDKTMIQIIDDSSMGGAENHTRLISKEFARRGYQILIICPPGPYVERLRELKSSYKDSIELIVSPYISKQYMNPFYGFDLYRLLKAIKLVRQSIKTKNIKLIHCHKHPVDLLIALSTIGLGDLRIITTIHSMDNKDKFWVWRYWRYFFIKYSLSGFDYIFAVSENVRKNTIRYFRLSPQKVVTMMNGTDLSELVPAISEDEARDQYLLPKDKFIIVCTAKLEYRKGQDIILRAVASLLGDKRVSQDILVLLAGTSNEDFKNKLILLAAELGIEERIKILGHVDNISDILQIADLYVQPSRWDPLPRALIEAMGTGVCSIGSGVDGIQELIEHEKTGLLFDNGDADDLANKIEYAMGSSDIRENLAEASAEKVKNHHTTRHMADTIEKHLFGEIS